MKRTYTINRTGAMYPRLFYGGHESLFQFNGWDVRRCGIGVLQVYLGFERTFLSFVHWTGQTQVKRLSSSCFRGQLLLQIIHEITVEWMAGQRQQNVIMF